MGETFFKTDATAGQNVYGCTATDTWMVQGAILVNSVFGRGGAVVAQTGDYSFSQISGTASNAQIAAGVDAAKVGAGTVSNTVFGYLAGVTSSIQTQLNGKAASAHSHTGGGDISGDITSATVGKIQNRAVATTVPSDGQVLTWSNTSNQWQPGTMSFSSPVSSIFGRTGVVVAQTGDYSFSQISGTASNAQIAAGVDAAKVGAGTVSNTVFGYLAGVTSDIQTQVNGKAASAHSHIGGGDISGDITSATVGKIQNRAVATTIPSDGQALIWSNTSNQWQPGTISISSPVSSIFGRTGAVVAQTGDYSFSQISGTASNAQIAAGVDAAKVGTGTVSNTVFGYLAGVTSDIQTQVNGKAASAHSHTGGGDISGDITSATVGKIQNRAVATTVPSDGQALVWSNTNNQWQPGTISGSGSSGATTASGLGDLMVTRTSATALTIGNSCSNATPCNVRYGASVYRITTPATVTLTSGSGTAFIYITPGGVLTVGHNVSLSCASCTAVSGITAYPQDSLPLWRIDAVSGAWDSAGGLDYRAFLSVKTVTSGTGVVTSESNGQTTVAVDTAVVGLRVAVPATATSSCAPGQWATDGSYYYLCVSASTWRRSALASW